MDKCTDNLTGVAYVALTGKSANLDNIKVVQDWGEHMSNDDKVPSVISYSKKSIKSQQQWGADLAKGSIAMVHTKLQLDVDSTSTELDQLLESLEGMHYLGIQYIKNTEGPTRYTSRGPEEIVSDYLERVFNCFRKAASYFTEEWTKQAQVDIVATIPAVRSYEKNHTNRDAANAKQN